MGLTRLLAGKWIFLALGGILQLTVMFAWGSLVFGLPLFSHLPGFFVMTIVTAGAAAALGLVLATLARSREQLSGFSTILVLTMSALGGSMFPRFLMSESMQKVGLLTFNAWALDGYLKVFWRDAAAVAAVATGAGAVRADRGVPGRRRGCWRDAGRRAYPRRALRRSRDAAARDLFLQIDAESLGHPVERPAIDAEDFGRPRAVATDLFDDVEQVAALDFVEGRQVGKQALVQVGHASLERAGRRPRSPIPG